MNDKRLLLSICIPTNGIVEWVIPVIDSIYSQGIDNSLFEVIVTDNGEKDELQEVVKQYKYSNFHYSRNNSKGFTNQIDAFERCSGVFCKMLNHRSVMLPGSIQSLIELIEKYRETKPVIYCLEGNTKGKEIVECENTDEFVKNMSFWTSWSSGTGVWHDDLKDLRSKKPDKMFPHLVFLFELRKNCKYVIWNKPYERMLDDSGKGGYDVFYTFGVHLLDLHKKLMEEGRITTSTFNKVKDELYVFLRDLYYNEVICHARHTFIIKDIHNSLRVYYGDMGYYRMAIRQRLKYCKDKFVKLLKHCCPKNIPPKVN